MTPKQKAVDLYEYYFGLVADTPDPEWRAKDGALNTVSEIIMVIDHEVHQQYWAKVAEEIKNL